MKAPVTTSLCVLLVEDNNDLRDAVGQCLDSKGYKVTKCGTCREASMALERPGSSFDILLVDLKLPDGEGLEVLKKARKHNPQLLAAIMTGYASLETALKAIRLGAYDYITKPFGFDEIEILVRNMTDKLLLMKENREIESRLKNLSAQIEKLRDDKAELMRANRELKAGFSQILGKLDQISGLLYGQSGSALRPV
ncbi:MAG: response regulator [Acidobacteriota bacterium]